jgi:anti-sigma B factor antagonist
MSALTIARRTQDAVAILDVRGEVDMHTAADLEAALQQCLADDCNRIVFNGGGLDYISSAGLGVFMAYIEDVRERGGDIKIAALQPKVFDVFDLLGFPMLFDIVETEQEALERFAATA